MQHVAGCYQLRPGECVKSNGTGVTNDFESPFECWESIMSPWKE